MTRLWFESVLLPEGWAERVQIDIALGRINSIIIGVAPTPDAERHTIGLPGLPNVHSHAFQRGMAGRTEVASGHADNFWSWREAMYRFVDAIDPDDMEAIAAFAYMEMLESGFTRVGEFHYVHHDRDGRHFADAAEMVHRIVAAAQASGIGLTLLPAFYAHSGFGGAVPDLRQARFVNDVEGYARLLEHSRQSVRSLDGAVVGVAPHSLRACTPAELRCVVAMAADGPIHIHLAEQVREVEDCLSWCGRRPATWLADEFDVDNRWCLVHATHVDRCELERIAASRATVGLCPITEANLGDGIFPAVQFAALCGSFAIGSDSNVLIDAAQELRVLEYAQRLVLRARNVITRNDGTSTGRMLFESAIEGRGASALEHKRRHPRAGFRGPDQPGLKPRRPGGRHGDAIIDAWIFAARPPVIDCVWRYGRKVVAGGRHLERGRIESNYKATIKKLFANRALQQVRIRDTHRSRCDYKNDPDSNGSDKEGTAN